MLAERAYEDQRWWPWPHQRLGTSNWDVYAPALAESDVDDDQWSKLATAFVVIGDANMRLERRGEDPPQFTPGDDKLVIGVIGALSMAMRVMHDLTGSFPIYADWTIVKHMREYGTAPHLVPPEDSSADVS